MARGDGSISRDNVRTVLEKFDVALTPAQSNDWNKSLDPSNTGAIEYGDLEDMLLDAHTATADPYAPRKVVDIIDKIKKYLHKIDYSVDDLLDLIHDVSDQITTDRKNVILVTSTLFLGSPFPRPRAAAVTCSTSCPCLLDADWSWQSDVVPDLRLQGLVDKTIGTVQFLDFRAAVRALHLDELKPMQRLQLASLLDKVRPLRRAMPY